MKILTSATRIVLLYLVLWLPLLTWRGIIPADKFFEAVLLVLGAFFGSKISESGELPK